MVASFAVVFAWLVAWPYVLPWYDGLGWALLALLPSSRLDWLMLARTAALAVGYLPGRTVVMPGRPGLAPDGSQGRRHAADPAGDHRGPGGDAVAAARGAGWPPRRRPPGR